MQGQKIGFEFKYADAPRITQSMQTLELDHLYLIYPGTVAYPLTEKITVMGLVNYLGKED